MPVFVSVILPLKLEWEPSYSVEEEVRPGTRVRVAFARKEYVGVVHRTGVKPDCDISKVLPVKELETGLASVSEEELRFWEFLSDYYLCTIGEVYKQAFPLLKLRSEVNALNNQRRSEERKENSRRRMAASLESRILRMSGRLDRKKAELDRRMEAEASGRSRIRRNLTESLKEEVSELESELSSARSAFDALLRSSSVQLPAPTVDFSPREKPDPGKPGIILSSDRLSEYEARVRKALDGGLDAFILVPEIAAGEILQKRLAVVFGDALLLFTSRTTPSLRRRTAEALRGSDGPYLIVGTRAALFLPFRNLGLVIIDNEQDSSYKQSDSSPRFNARDAALMLARIHNAQAVLGTACPSLETVYNSLSGKYRPLPSFRPEFSGRTLIDIAAERRKNGMVGCFSRKLIEMVGRTAGPVAFIYGWEKPDDLQKSIDGLFSGRETALLTFPEARRIDLSAFALVAVLQADFLTGRDDFRADERAFQALSVIGDSVTGHFVIQTARPGHQIFGLSDPAQLLSERRDFGLPPFTRIVDVRISDGSAPRLELMAARLRRELGPSYEIPSDDSLTLRCFLQTGAAMRHGKQAIRTSVLAVEKTMNYPGHITIDVDPV